MTEVIEQKEEQVEAEKEPKMNFTIFYSGHVRAGDFDKLKALFEEADIYVPESIGWDKREKELFSRMSAGEIDGETFKEMLSKFEKDDPVLAEEYKIIYNSHKPIEFLDVPGDNQTHKDTVMALEGEYDAYLGFLDGEFDEAVSEMKGASEKYAIAQQEREKYIKSLANSRLKDLVEKNQALKDKIKKGGGINVLMSIGADHTALASGLKKDWPGGVETKFSDSPFIFDYDAELYRRYMFNKEVGDELVAKALLSRGLVYKFRNFCRNHQEISVVSRKIISGLTFNDIRKISESLGAGDDLQKAFDSLGRDIKIPESREEVDKILGKNNKS